MHDHAASKIAVDHLAARKNTVAGDNPVEFAFFKKTEVEKTVYQSDLGKIYTSKSTPCHIGSRYGLLA
jgi:hypothetical protein